MRNTKEEQIFKKVLNREKHQLKIRDLLMKTDKIRNCKNEKMF